MKHFIPGEPADRQLSANNLNKLVDAIVAATPRPTVGARLVQMPQGFINTPIKRRQPLPDTDFRFKIIDASTVVGSVRTAKVRLVPGTVDGLSPKIGTDALDSDPPPTLTLTNGVKNIIVLKVTFTADQTTVDTYTYLLPNGTITDPLIQAYDDGSVPADTDPENDAPEGTYYTRIGFADVDGDGRITNIQNDGVRTSLVSHFCPGSSMWYSTI